MSDTGFKEYLGTKKSRIIFRYGISVLKDENERAAYDRFENDLRTCGSIMDILCMLDLYGIDHESNRNWGDDNRPTIRRLVNGMVKKTYAYQIQEPHKEEAHYYMHINELPQIYKFIINTGRTSSDIKEDNLAIRVMKELLGR